MTDPRWREHIAIHGNEPDLTQWEPEPDPLDDDPEYIAWCERQAARGDLAGAPETMGCYECGGFDGRTAPERAVVGLGPIAEARRDPTQTYRLSCGHLAI